ncbi:AraC family transcriptional regulator [Rugamonas sp. CCM 8940]|uniref:helix-turn-helix transcriptional regulator n=1 Tax=Rugamonas sp. CCM 8940 TaxID=2765359 RepID=UPI0018F53C95|nr:helix-turn-helix transcriptional regulator [Rugamonas sp. CCM 8940]MBJ7313157.1 helix-turn-helix transcriptional regulator [Rugamonas sp. CCM 8940]
MQTFDIFEYRLNDQTPMLLTPQYDKLSNTKQAHSHPEGQLYIAFHGLIVIEAGGDRAVLAPGRLGWVPPNMPHGASVHGHQLKHGLAGYTIHLAPSLCATLPTQAKVLRISPLARALLERMSEWPQGVPTDAAALRLMTVFLDEVGKAEPDPLHLTMPRQPRLLTMAATIAENPADDTDLDSWALQLGLSRRSISRHFRAETGMSLVEWRQIARLQKGVEWLSAGQSVTTVAMELGYDSVSSFIALFRRTLGTTPAQFANAKLSERQRQYARVGP